MKKIIFSIVFPVLVLLNIATAVAQEVFIKEANAIIYQNKNTICITRDTKQVDLSGTPFNYDGAASAISIVTQTLKDDAYENVHAVFMEMTDDYDLYEVQIGVIKDESTYTVWDYSLIPDLDKRVNYAKEFIEIYDTGNDRWIGMRGDSDIDMLVYATVNNGQTVSANIGSYYAISESEHVKYAHDFLDRISFTHKSPKPENISNESEQQESKNLLQRWLQKMWSLIERYIAFDIANYLLLGALLLIVGAFSVVASVFKRKK